MFFHPFARFNPTHPSNKEKTMTSESLRTFNQEAHSTDHHPDRLHQQRGFSLVEMGVVLVVMAVIAAVFLESFSGNTSKAVRLLTDMTTISNSVKRAQSELGGIPSKLSILWNRSDATAANMFNGILATNSWNGPYMERQATDASNLIKEPDVADSATISIHREAASAANGGNYTWVYFVRGNNIPNPIIEEFMKKCVGTTTQSDWTFAKGKCRATMGTGATEIGTVEMMIADSR